MLENALSIIEQCPKSQKPRTKGILSLSLSIAFPTKGAGYRSGGESGQAVRECPPPLPDWDSSKLSGWGWQGVMDFCTKFFFTGLDKISCRPIFVPCLP